MATIRDINELYCEACACIEQGLCYDEIDDTVSFAYYICWYCLIKKDYCIVVQKLFIFKRDQFQENALAFYDRSLLLIKEATKEQNYKKSDMYKVAMEGKNRVKARIKDLKTRGKKQKQIKDETSDIKKMKMENEEVIVEVIIFNFKNLIANFSNKLLER